MEPTQAPDWISGVTSGICRRVSDVTQMLEAMQRGEPQAVEKLSVMVYEELRQIAKFKMMQESPGHTLQPTALVHEVWLRLLGQGQPPFAGRAHFFAAAAEAMRRILVDAARRKRSLKRGGGITPNELHDSRLVWNVPSDEILEVDEALRQLAAVDPAAADLVKLRYFVGMTMSDAATALGLSLRSTERLWAYARAWLRRRLGDSPG